jgi:hypothetical protein
MGEENQYGKIEKIITPGQVKNKNCAEGTSSQTGNI